MDATPDQLAPATAPARPAERTASGGRAATLLACTLFVLSGACGLAYEVVWAKFLGLFLGNTVLLHTAVLGAFMGGLALGSLLLGRRAAASAAPLKVYGWLELGVAAYALAFPALAGLAQGAVGAAAGALTPGSLPLLAVKIAVAAALLLPPTLVLGATFPFLTAHLERTTGRGEAGANWLYFANCMGAVLGTLLTGFCLIPSLGLTATVTAVAIFNAAIGLTAIAAGAAAPRRPGAAAEAAASPTSRVVLVAIALSGATAFVYEIVWVRLFAVSLGSSTYSFTLMLAAFITGLGAGSVAANLIPAARARPLAALAVAELLIGLAIVASLPLYPRLPYWSWQWKWLLRPTPESIGLYHALQYGLTFLVMSVPTFLFGLTFPAAIRAAGGGAGSGATSAHAARVYGWNTIGTLAGVTAAGALLIPWLGLRGTLQVGAVGNLALGAWLLIRAFPGLRTPALVAGGVGAAAALLTPAWPPLSYASFRANQAPPATWKQYAEIAAGRKLVFYREDHGTTVAVEELRHPSTGIVERALIVDGKTDATSYGDLPTQSLLGHLPLLLNPGARSVLVIGLGSGVTVGSVFTHPVERVDCVEISPAVAAAAEHFSAANRDALRDPRLHLTLDDGKTFLAAAPRRYDVIISEPTNPWISGVGNLFSEESFRAAAAALNPGGLCAQWFHTYALDDALVATIVRTFRSVFPHTVIFQGTEGDYLLVGSREALRPDWAALARRIETPAVRDDLARISVRGVAGFLARQSHSDAAAAALAEGGGINSDDLPLLEYRAPHALYLGRTAERIPALDTRRGDGRGLLLHEFLGGRGFDRAETEAVLTALSDPRAGSPDLHLPLLEAYARRWPGTGEPLLRAARARAARGDLSAARRWAEQAVALRTPGAAGILGQLAAAERPAASAFPVGSQAPPPP